MSVAEKLTTIAENEQKVYDAGKEAGRDINPEWTDWGYFSYNNNRNDLAKKLRYSDTSKGIKFNSMFLNCSTLTSIPQLDTSKGTNFSSMFSACSTLTSIPQLDTSNGTDFAQMFYSCKALTSIPQLDTSKGIKFSSMFALCSTLTSIPQLDTSKGTNFNSMFHSCKALTSIPQLDTSKGTNFGNMFYNCTALTDITFTGTFLVKSNISVFANSQKLTVESLMSFINALKNDSTTVYKVTIGSTNLAKLTEAQKAIATAKNITLA